ncbi:dipeptide ABC transporter ATP-binding protein [Gluconacetobacter sp. Hr-1-5]|uniref:dipeptide ABC transporter ATP-binding protein n=1 Tax=Gluconacetobacter sp. Hr-1-5 TaxID=3395370 RepID=UPI003B52D72A
MTDPLLQVRNLHIATRAGTTLVHDFGLDLAAGERLAIIGESGSGKTMATRALVSLLPPAAQVAGGTIRFQGQEITRLAKPAMQRLRGPGIGMVFQEPMTSLNPALTIGRQLSEGLQRHRRLSRTAIRGLVIDMLHRVRIRDPERCLTAYPHEFSGGMRQRIMLASVLLLKPRLLIADEPTTALDVLSQREVMDIMVELTREQGTALLLISHDLPLVERYTDRAIVMQKGIVVEAGLTGSMMAHPTHPYTRQLIGALPRPKAASPASSTDKAPVLLSINRLCVDYPTKRGLLRAGQPRRVLDTVSLQVRSGEIVALVGGSGSGKTTLGRTVLGLTPFVSGSVRFDGSDIATLGTTALRDFRRQVQLVFQDPFSSLDPRLCVAEIVAATLRHVPGLDAATRRTRTDAALAAVDLAGFERRLPHEMSGGQRQRVAIARAIVSGPKLVVADEPVSALDLSVQQQVLTLLQTLQHEQGFACLFITHDLSVVEQVADRVVVMENGTIVEEGLVDAVFSNPQHSYTRQLLAATPRAAPLPDLQAL